MTNTERMERLLEIVRQEGWKAKREDDCWEFSQASPAGEDFSFEVSCGEKEDPEDFVRSVEMYAEDFDVDEHVEMWVQARHGGVGGVPSISELVSDAEAIKEMLDSLASALRRKRGMSAIEYAEWRIEMTRRSLAELTAAVELGTDLGCRLQEILVTAQNEVEALAEEAHEAVYAEQEDEDE